MSYDFENRFPALSVLFARAAMLGSPEHTFDNEMLLDVIRTGRAELDLDPCKDQAEAYFDWTLEKMEEDRAEQDRSKELEDLNEKLRSADELARQRMKELQEKERELESLTRAFQKAGEAYRRLPDPDRSFASPADPVERKLRIEGARPDSPKGHRELDQAIRPFLRSRIMKALPALHQGSSPQPGIAPANSS